MGFYQGKMMGFKQIILSVVSIHMFLSADILEMEHLRDIRCHIDPETIVVFDIDNTLLEAEDHLGSVAWGDFIARELESKGISKEEAQEVVSIFWRTVQPHIQVKAVDGEAGQIIHEMQDQKVKVMCLTARMPQELLCTLKQLDAIGVNIQETAPVADSAEMIFNRKALYSNGILFATPFNKKSEVFISFLKINKLPYKRVIFVDDKQSHVLDLQEALEREGIDCVAIRFAGADNRVKQFDPVAAELQWKNFQKK